MDMTDLNALRQVAEELRRQGPYWRTFRPVEHLMGWLYDEGKCVYCDVNLVPAHTKARSATTDHLLPKGQYPELHTDPLNAVPACADCNHTKGTWDPNENGERPQCLTSEMRRDFIARAKEHIRAKRQRGEATSQQDLAAWQEALEALATLRSGSKLVR